MKYPSNHHVAGLHKRMVVYKDFFVWSQGFNVHRAGTYAGSMCPIIKLRVLLCSSQGPT